MTLYENRDEFRAALVSAANVLGVSQAIVEKDYFVTVLLKKIVDRVPGIMFKGGTCLSKCFKLIDRFSEDIDLTLDEAHFTQGNKRGANRTILSICDELGFVVRNRSQVEKHSHGTYNCYEIEYPRTQDDNGLIPYVKLELVFIQKSYPCVMKEVNSMIGEALTTEKNIEAMKEMGVEPFQIKAQALERTFVDKVFAICDYYLRKESLRQSRHIYDIYKLYPVIDKTDLPRLICEVRKDRRKNKTCLSAADECDVSLIIKEFVSNGYFKVDYDTITSSLLSKKVSYDEAIKVLMEVSNSGLF